MRETDLFEPVKRLLEEVGYIVYPEVEGPGGRADMVGIRGPELVATGIDVPLPRIPQAGKAYNIAKTLRSVADLLDQQRPGAEFSIGGKECEAEVPPDGVRPQTPRYD